jgi:hypothetical protein
MWPACWACTDRPFPMLPLPPHRLYRPAMAVVAVAAALAAPAAWGAKMSLSSG